MFIIRRTFAFAASLILFGIASGQNGAPLLSNYRESREIENQSWAICQDQYNVMMFANRRGILTFDGQDWNLIDMPSVPYSLKFCPANSKVYVGCDNNYGYIQKDQKGIYEFVSLSGDSAGVGLITKVLTTDSTVFYYGDQSISRHNLLTGKLEKRWLSKNSEPFTGMFITPKNTFINVMKKGLHRLEADSLFPIVTGYLLGSEEVLFSLPYNKNLVLLGLGKGSLSLFDGLKFSDYQIKDDGYLKQNILSDGITVSDSLYSFSTLDGGAVVVEKTSGKLVNTINYQNGLPDDEIFAIGRDNNYGLWLSHQYGLTRADLNLPVGNFSIYPGLKGNFTTAIWYNNELYVATSEGVFYLTETRSFSEPQTISKPEISKSTTAAVSPGQQTQEVTKPRTGLFSRIFGKKTTTPQKNETEAKKETGKKEDKGKQTTIKNAQQETRKSVARISTVTYQYKKIDGLNEKCRQLVSTPEGILASSNKGLYLISNHSARLLVSDRYINYIGKKTKSDRYYIATNDGYFYVTPETGSLKPVFPDKSFSQTLHTVVSTNNALWAGGDNLVIRIKPATGSLPAEYHSYIIKSNFPQKCLVEEINDTLFLLTETGVSCYDEKSDSFVPQKRFDLIEGAKLNYIINQPEVPWFNQGDEWISLNSGMKLTKYDIALLKIFNEVISVHMTDRYLLLVTADNQVYRIERNRTITIKPQLDLYIRSITNDNGIYFKLSDIVFGRGDNTVYFDIVAPGYLKQNSTQYQYLVEKTMNDWSKWSTSSTITLMLTPGEYTLKVRAKDIWGNISEPKSLVFKIKAPFTQTLIFYILCIITAMIIFITVVRFREKQLKKDKQILEEKVRERTAKIEAQKQEITSSIAYASRIQMAMLPAEEIFSKTFSDYFIFFRPRDIVSGDFYWIGEDKEHICFTVADCTGHGVPGAFMSTLGISTLNEIISNKSDLQANLVLNLLREKTKNSLHQTGREGEAKDGMDISLCVLHKNRKTLEYSGAYNPLFLFQGGEFKEYKGDRMPIGIYYGEKESFTNYEIPVKKGDAIYLFSDGFADQFGGPDGTKYKKANLKKLLSEIYYRPMSEQRDIIEKELKNWRGDLPQVDDITLIGVRI